VASLPKPFSAYTQQELLALYNRLLPLEYIAPLKSPGPGYEVFEAAAKMGERASLAVERVATGAYILSATGGAYSVGAVEFYRPSPSAEIPPITVVVKAGTIVVASKSGRRYVTTADATFGPADLGPILVPVQATVMSFDYDVPGIILTPDGTVLPGEIDAIETLVEEPPLGDLTIQVRHPVPTTGGRDASLDQQGADRGIPRAVGEDDDSYRDRIRTIPDTISPNAVDRALQQLLYPYGQSYGFIECWDINYQTCWDAPALTVPGSSYDPNLFVYDDPRPPLPFRNRWLGESDFRGGFIVTVPAYGPVKDVGMAFDDVATDAFDLANPLGFRALGAYDVPSTLAGGFLQGCFDGYDVARAATMKTVYETLQRIKAGGISAALELEGE
jgi:hypothetical protein